MDGYQVNPGKISLADFFGMLNVRKLVPSRRILQERSQELFQSLTKLQLETLADLLPRVKNKTVLHQLASESGIPEKTLAILAREARSVLVKPESLDALADFPFEYREVLRSKGISNTEKLWTLTLTEGDRKELSARTGIPSHRLKDLHERCDLLRITGVGPVFARIVHHSGIHSVKQFAETPPPRHIQLYEGGMKELGMDALPLGEDDMQYCLDYAHMILEYAGTDAH